MAKKKEKTLEEKLQEALVPENQWPYILPENWCWTRLDFIANYKKGPFGSSLTKAMFVPKGKNTYKVYEQGNAINKSTQYGSYYITKEKYDSMDGFSVEPDDIIVSCAGTIGEIFRLPQNIEKGIINQALMRVRLNSSVVYQIFEYYFSKILIQNITDESNGTAIKNIPPFKVLKQMPFPLPPLPEQKRIVNRIESLFAKLDEAKEKIQQVLDGAEMRKAAILHKAFTGELTKTWRKENGISEDSWESVKLKELGEFNRGKSKHRPRNDPRLFNGPYPFIQTGDVSSSGMYIQKHSQTLSEFGMQQSRLFPKDTLCITIAANIGKVAILTYDCCFPDSVVGFTPNERTFSKYMYYSMLKIQKEIEALAPAVAQKNLSLKLLLDVNVQIPSVEEQHTIVKIIERLLKHEKNVISSSMRSIESIETMKKSILAKAFRGELGTNNPTEDSALNLLKEVLQDKF